MLSAITSFKPPGYAVATLAVSLAGWLGGNDTGSIGAVTVMPHFLDTFGDLSPFMRGLTVSMIMLTGAIPSFYAGQLADIFGRLRIIALGAVLYSIGAAIECAASRLPVFILGRAIAGIGIGTWMSPLFVYVTEIAPSAKRGMICSGPQLATTLGICSGYFTAYGSVKIDSDMSWRTVYIIQMIGGMSLAGLCFIIPESPRWELLKGRTERAIVQLKRLDFDQVEAEKDLLGPAAQRQILAQPSLVKGLIMIFRRPYRSRTSLALVMLGMIQLSGIDGVLYYAPTLFAQAGLSATTASFIASGVSALLMFAITIPALIFVDRFERRSITLAGGLLLTTCMFTIGSLYAAGAVHSTGAARFVVIVLVFVFSLTYCATWGVVGKIYASEIQPRETRSSANCVAQGLGFLTNWLVAILTPVLLASSSFSAYFLFGSFCIVSVSGLWLYMPETKGQSLEAIEDAFANPLRGDSNALRLLTKIFGRVRHGHRHARPTLDSTAGRNNESRSSSVRTEEPMELSDMLHSNGKLATASAVEAGPSQ